MCKVCNCEVFARQNIAKSKANEFPVISHNSGPLVFRSTAYMNMEWTTMSQDFTVSIIHGLHQVCQITYLSYTMLIDKVFHYGRFT